MPIATLDFESYWDQEYTLKKMSPLEYVMDERFEAQFLSVKWGSSAPLVVMGDEIEPYLRSVDWSNTAVLGHNMAGFDAYILAYRYGINPRLWMCTQAMARPVYGKVCNLSLYALCKHLGIGNKDNSALVNTRGKRLKDFTPGEIEAMRAYNGEDTNLDWKLFQHLRQFFSSQEMWQIDALVRMRTEPKFVLDFGLLESAASVERTRKHKALLDLARELRGYGASADLDWENENEIAEFVRAELASASRFAALLEHLGAEVPMKASPTDPEKMIPALAKTDEEFQALQESEDPLVAVAALTRLDVKSTILETRIQKFVTAANLAGGLLPIPVRYCGADTTGRDSGEEYNPQNMPRVNKKAPKPSDSLRRSLTAGSGNKIIVADQSGIELRVNHFLWQVPSSMELYRASPDKADLYRMFAATNLYYVPPEQIDANQRQLGKVSHLGLGFGAAAETFMRVARTQYGVRLDLDASPGSDRLSARQIVLAWRAAYPEICDGWKRCDQALRAIYEGREEPVDPWGLVWTCKEGFRLPSGRLIRYPNLRREEDGKWPDGRTKRSWFYGDGRHRARITGPKADENIVQALARDSIFDCALAYYRQTGLRFNLRVHDELVYVVDEGSASERLAQLQAVMRTPPSWWPELIVSSEGGIGDTYADAK